MVTAFISHPSCRRHDMGTGHPECPQRLDAITDSLISLRVFDLLAHYDAPPATRAQLLRVHTADYLDWLERIAPRSGLAAIDPDTSMNPHTLTAAYHAAGALVLATDLVAQRRADNAFCNVRPPGHHAERERAMGFCFLNNVAVGVAHAIAEHHLDRIAVLDFDVHFGNGTDNIFAADPRVQICSLYEQGLYPNVDACPDSSNVDIPLAAGTSGEAMRAAVRDTWLPALERFRPQMLFVSAGFDAHERDPLGNLRLREDDYRWLTEQIVAVGKRHAAGRIVSTLEGGYDLLALARCATAHVQALAGLGF